jgi:hypothetical protein
MLWIWRPKRLAYPDGVRTGGKVWTVVEHSSLDAFRQASIQKGRGKVTRNTGQQFQALSDASQSLM